MGAATVATSTGLDGRSLSVKKGTLRQYLVYEDAWKRSSISDSPETWSRGQSASRQ